MDRGINSLSLQWVKSGASKNAPVQAAISLEVESWYIIYDSVRTTNCARGLFVCVTLKHIYDLYRRNYLFWFRVPKMNMKTKRQKLSRMYLRSRYWILIAFPLNLTWFPSLQFLSCIASFVRTSSMQHGIAFLLVGRGLSVTWGKAGRFYVHFNSLCFFQRIPGIVALMRIVRGNPVLPLTIWTTHWPRNVSAGGKGSWFLNTQSGNWSVQKLLFKSHKTKFSYVLAIILYRCAAILSVF